MRRSDRLSIFRPMAKQPLEKILVEAQKAYQKRDKRLGARLIDEILQQDLNYPGAWDLLYRLFGGGRPFDDFQRSFVTQYYPDKLSELRPRLPGEPDGKAGVSSGQIAAEKKPGFLNKLFGQPKTASSEPAPIAPAIPSRTPLAAAEVLTPASSADVSPRTYSSFSSPVATPAPSEGFSSASSGAFAALRISTSTEKVRVLLVDDIAQTRETVARSLRFQENIEVIGTGSTGLEAIHLTRELKPDVVIMDVNMPDMDGIAATAIIKRDAPATEVIILTVQDDIDYMRRAMLAGARDFLSKPPMIDDLVQSVLRAGEQSRLQREKLPPARLARNAPVPVMGGKIITVFSPRGGSGCTVIAANLAVALYSEDTSTVIVDGDLQYGDVPVLFNSVNKLNILDLSPRVAELDQDMVEEVLTTHSSGVRILHPPRLERAELVAGPHFRQLLTYLSKHYNYVIVDTSHRLSEVTMAALDVSNLILLVSTLDIPAMARTRKFFELVPELSLDPRLIMLVINQFDQRVGITSEKLTQAFGREPDAIIPLARDLVLESINRGIPFLLRKSDAALPIGQAMLKTARTVRSRLVELDNIGLEKHAGKAG
jgi:pilus assembly protein CpaE